MDKKAPKLRYATGKPGTFQMLDTIHSTTEFKNIIKNTIDSYDFFSKLDHYGIFYFKVVEMSLKAPLDNILSRLDVLPGYFAVLQVILGRYSKPAAFLDDQLKLSMALAALRMPKG